MMDSKIRKKDASTCKGADMGHWSYLFERSAGILPASFFDAGWKPALLS